MFNIKSSTLITIFMSLFSLIFFLRGSAIVWANECPQPRKTQVAPPTFLNKKNPLRKEPRHIKKGKVLAHIKAKPVACKQCHGMLGDGNGSMGNLLNPKPRNFTCKETMKEISDGQLFWIIKNGSEGTSMPPYKHLSDEKVWQLIHYIRSLSESAS
ncbi:MAG: c-type cytochrome [Nitrospinota bacterium]|nr:c-type cytochrome [Nitrospinota bacterium]